MSTYILMKLLERTPQFYDRGFRLLTGRVLESVYDNLTDLIGPEQKVLDIGCGTGALTIRAALKGAYVKGIDTNPAMLEIAQHKAKAQGCINNIDFCEMGVAELEIEETAKYDLVMSGLCFSELSFEELHFTLVQVRRILKRTGLLLVVAEVQPKKTMKRILSLVLRIPALFITYCLTWTTTTAFKDLPQVLEQNGFTVESASLYRLDTLGYYRTRNS